MNKLLDICPLTLGILLFHWLSTPCSSFYVKCSVFSVIKPTVDNLSVFMSTNVLSVNNLECERHFCFCSSVNTLSVDNLYLFYMHTCHWHITFKKNPLSIVTQTIIHETFLFIFSAGIIWEVFFSPFISISPFKLFLSISMLFVQLSIFSCKQLSEAIQTDPAYLAASSWCVHPKIRPQSEAVMGRGQGTHCTRKVIVYLSCAVVQCNVYLSCAVLQCNVYLYWVVLQCIVYLYWVVLQCNVYVYWVVLQCSICGLSCNVMLICSVLSCSAVFICSALSCSAVFICSALSCNAIFICSVLSCNAMFICSMLPCNAMSICSVLSCNAMFICSVLPCNAMLICSVLPCNAMFICSVLPCNAMLICSVLPCNAMFTYTMLSCKAVFICTVLYCNAVFICTAVLQCNVYSSNL